MSKPYFRKVKTGRKVYGLVFGLGKVIEVFDEGHYKFIVKFKNGHEVPYTIEGVPSWGNFSEQTLYYKKDIDLSSYDFTASKKILSVKKIIKLRDKGKLEVRLPSGIWCECTSCVEEYVEEMLEKQKFHLFRKKA